MGYQSTVDGRGRGAPAAGLFISTRKGHAFAGAAQRGPALRLSTRRAAPCQGDVRGEAMDWRASTAAPLAVGYVARERLNMGRRPIPHPVRRASSSAEAPSSTAHSSREGATRAAITAGPPQLARQRKQAQGHRPWHLEHRQPERGRAALSRRSLCRSGGGMRSNPTR